MKILHVISSLEIGGAQRLMADLLPLMKKEHDVTILVNKHVDSSFERSIIEAGVIILSMDQPNLYSFANLFSLIKLIKGYDVVHVHLFHMLYWVALASLFTNINLVYTEHNTSNRRRGRWYLRPIERFIYSRYRKIISISEQTQDALMIWLGARKDDKRFVVINNGINISVFMNVEKEKIYPHTLIMVARFAPAKDQNTIIRAVALLDKDVHAIFVGDGDRLDECKTLAKELNVDDRVHFVGMQSNVPSWLAKADIGIQSSFWEGFGLTAVEMMAAGLPVIASDVDGVKQVVEGAGLLFPCKNENKLAENIEKLIKDKDFYNIVMQRCIERSKLYDIENMLRAYINVYIELEEVEIKRK